MNILWDMRLYSTGYENRGVGRYCLEVARSMLTKNPDCSIYIWADTQHLPPQLRTSQVTIIPYHKGTWKSSVFRLPHLVLKYRIDLLHYWVTLGPLTSIGITPFPTAPSVATVHDLGVELWDTPHSCFIRRTPYWHMQRRFFKAVSAIMTNSAATCSNVVTHLPTDGKPHITAYPPFSPSDILPVGATGRKPYLITLGGAPHKNLRRTIAAFAEVRTFRPDAQLILLGNTDPSENLPNPLPDGVVHAPSMEHYAQHLRQSGGLAFCSLHEGLGLPPIEAMHHGCPLLLADLPPHRETCGAGARFVDPLSESSIAEGMRDILEHTDAWCRKSVEGAEAYSRQCKDTPLRIFRLYEQITGQYIHLDT
ncbi:MAG: glycosyltransferase [Chitinispirillaceae bacterium]|nr:glycosyltransferase [Chitinispirillaceae bacterium]